MTQINVIRHIFVMRVSCNFSDNKSKSYRIDSKKNTKEEKKTTWQLKTTVQYKTRPHTTTRINGQRIRRHRFDNWRSDRIPSYSLQWIPWFLWHLHSLLKRSNSSLFLVTLKGSRDSLITISKIKQLERRHLFSLGLTYQDDQNRKSAIII